MIMLIIEDDGNYVQLLQRYLEGLADEIVIARSWAQAEPHFATADIMWVDLIIPPHDEDFATIKLREIRQVNPKAVVFVVSGMMGEGIEQKVVEAGADMFAEKFNAMGQKQIIAMMIQALMKAEERGRDATKFLEKARELLKENPSPLTTI